MAGPAFRLRIDPHHPSMSRSRIEQFSGNICMTGRTTVVHAVGIPGRGVTGFTVSRNVGVGRDAAQDLAGFRIQRAWTIHGSTRRQGGNRDRQSCEECCKKSCTRETTRASCLHLPPYLGQVLPSNAAQAAWNPS
jgi:hypothetical protein